MMPGGSELEIRRANINDAVLVTGLVEPVQQLHIDARPDYFKPLPPDTEMVEFYTELLDDPDNYIFIAEVGNIPVGYVCAQIVTRPENPFTYTMNYIVVDQMSVNPAHRSKGYGELLMKRVFELAHDRRVSHIMLTVWSFNRRAREFYERLGFSTCHERMEIFLETG